MKQYHFPDDDSHPADVCKAQIVFLLKEALHGVASDDAFSEHWVGHQYLGAKKACWRLADAGAKLRLALENMGVSDCLGLDSPTRNGALLPHFSPGPETSPVLDALRCQADALETLAFEVRDLRAAIKSIPSYSTVAKAYADHCAITGGEENARRILRGLRATSITDLDPKDYAYFLKALAE